MEPREAKRESHIGRMTGKGKGSHQILDVRTLDTLPSSLQSAPYFAQYIRQMHMASSSLCLHGLPAESLC